MILCPAYSGPITDMRSGHQLGACSIGNAFTATTYTNCLLIQNLERDASMHNLVGLLAMIPLVRLLLKYAMYIERNCVRSLGLLLHFHCRLFTLFPPEIPFEYTTTEVFTLQKRERLSEPVPRGGCQTGDSRTSAPTIQPALEYSLPA